MVKTTYYKNRLISQKHMLTSSFTKVITVGSNHSLDFVENSKLMENAIQTTASIVFKGTPQKNS